MRNNQLGQGIALVKHYFPGRDITEQSIAEALWLQEAQSKTMEHAVANAIAHCFKK